MAVSTETNNQDQKRDPLAMSDEEFANLDPSEFDDMADDFDQDSATDEDTGDTDESDAGAAAEADDEDGDDSEDDDENTDDESDDDDDEEEADDTDGSDDGSDDEDSEADTDEQDEDSEESDDNSDEEEGETDFEAQYKELMAPFKANGKEMQPRNVEEARQLMQMGANYNKKMASLKPSLKTLKLLEKHDLLGEEKISHVIDLAKGDKGAIQKLMKDRGVDPMDLDDTEESDYQPNTYNVDDSEVELDQVLEEIQDTSTYSDTINVVTNKWDESSRSIIRNNPSVLKTLNEQMQNGIYERVATEVERQRTFGSKAIEGLSDIEAYKQVGDQLDQQGAFNDLVKGNSQTQGNEQTQSKSRKVPRKPKPKQDPKVKDKKRAASSTRSKPSNKQSADDFNPLSMSDEEFEKMFNESLM